mmetsp:Transcript_444/g.250  ORF Transcript_444/g.250 Transcript_444/m.250 type:complete len:375 (-) Transcript_444:1202-2326(-)
MNRTSFAILATFTSRSAEAPPFRRPLSDLCQIAVSVDVIRQVQQSDFGFGTDQTNRSEDHPPSHHRLNAKHMFNPTTFSRSRSIAPSLPFCQLAMPVSLSLQMLTKTTLFQSLNRFSRTIGRIRIHISAAVVLIEQMIKHMLVMNRCIRNIIIPYQLMLDIHAYVVFIPVMVFTVLLGPSGIYIFLTLFCLSPVFRNITLLDPFVIFSTVPLTGCLYNAGINDLPFLSQKTTFPKVGVKLLKQRLDQPCFSNLFTKQPDCLGIRHSVSKAEIQKTHKRYSIKNLKFNPVIGKIVQRLNNENFEYQNNIIGLCASITISFFVTDLFKRLSKYLPVNNLIKFKKWIAVFVQFFKSVLPVEKPGLHHRFFLLNCFNY